MRLGREFCNRDAVELAPMLLGKVICRNWNGDILRGRITEVEAYMPYDSACHAHRGKTARNAPMFEPGGTAYVYLCYGIHEIFNVVSGPEGSPQGVMIRGIEGAIGPGRATKVLKIDRSLSGIDLMASDEIWIEDDGYSFNSFEVKTRIGIDYADEVDRARLWRFVAK